MPEPDETSEAIPLVEEKLSVEKRPIETGRVRIHTHVQEHLTRVEEELEREDVAIESVVINREVDEVPQVREENGVLIVPLVEEVLVVEKRLLLKQELHVRRNRQRETVGEAVRLRRMRAEVERLSPQQPREADGDADVLRSSRIHRKDT